MTVATQLEILDLRHFSAKQLRPLLEHEAEVWRRRLRWNYQSSTELLLEYLDARSLPGLVALDHGRICGFTFCVYEGHKAVIGDAYALTADETEALPIIRTLLHHLIQMLQHSPTLDRIESQLLLYDAGDLSEVFLSAGFSLHPRRFLEMSLRSDLVTRAPLPVIPSDIELAPWSAEAYQQAAELIHLAYIDHIDARINDQYRSLHGSLRFLHNIVRFPGCGIFDPTTSWVLRERRTQTLVGIVLCSDIGEQVRHITQLCIAPSQRGRGLGDLLMRHAVHSLLATSTQAVSLTVTEANDAAMRLYDRLGFATRHRFEAMVYDIENTY